MSVRASTRPLHAWAAMYASMGWALVQLEGKVPQGYGWQNALPLDKESASSIWQEKDCNMGLVLGPSGVIDFELDGGDEDLYYELAGNGTILTPRYLSGSGRPHTLFRDPGNLTRRTRDGMELRAGPHQSVLPPSIHPDTGEPYQWIEDPTTPLADPPQALLDFFAEDKPGATNEGHWRNALERGTKLSDGEGRYPSLLSYLGMAVNQFQSPEQLAAAAIAFAAVTQDPPYPDDEIVKHAFDIWRKFREEPEDEEAGLKVIRATDIHLRSIEFLWRPFLQRSAFHLFVGKKGAGKGSLLTWLAAQMTTGFLDEERGVVSDPQAVLWVSTEDSFEIDVKPRFMAQEGDTDLLLCVQQRVLLPRDEESLRETCKNHNVGMVIIDPIISTLERGSDANDEASVVSAIGCLNALADELDLTILGVRHLGKSVDRGPLEAVLGSAAWVNTPRAVLGLAQDEDSKIATLEILAGNRVRGRVAWDFTVDEAKVPGVAEPVSFIVSKGLSDASMAQVLSREKGSKIPAIREWLLELLETNHEIPQASLVDQCVERFGVGRRSLQRACTEMTKEGLIRSLPDPASPRGPDGRMLPGGNWIIVRAIPEDM